MKKQTGLTLIEILISAGLVIIILGGGFYLYTSFRDDTQNTGTDQQEEVITEEGGETTTETGTTTENEPEGTLDTPTNTKSNYREIYNDKKYGFEIRYPDSLAFGGENSAEKLLFSLSDSSQNISYEFWIQELNGNTLENIFEERLKLEDISYFDWIKDQGGKVNSENLGENTWLFIDGSAKFYLDSHYMILIPGHDAYLIVDLGFPSDESLQLVRDVLSTLRFIE